MIEVLALQSFHLLVGVGDDAALLAGDVLGGRRHVEQPQGRAGPSRKAGDERHDGLRELRSIEGDEDALGHGALHPASTRVLRAVTLQTGYWPEISSCREAGMYASSAATVSRTWRRCPRGPRGPRAPAAPRSTAARPLRGRAAARRGLGAMKGGESFLNLYSHDFVRVAVATPEIRVADPAFNGRRTVDGMYPDGPAAGHPGTLPGARASLLTGGGPRLSRRGSRAGVARCRSRGRHPPLEGAAVVRRRGAPG
jgi:hypothetical protein